MQAACADYLRVLANRSQPQQIGHHINVQVPLLCPSLFFFSFLSSDVSSASQHHEPGAGRSRCCLSQSQNLLHEPIWMSASLAICPPFAKTEASRLRFRALRLCSPLTGIVRQGGMAHVLLESTYRDGGWVGGGVLSSQDSQAAMASPPSAGTKEM